MLKFLKITFCSLPLLWASTFCANAVELTGSEWGIDKPVEQFIKFSGDEQVFGHAGCNRFFGSYTTDKSKGTITIGPLASTKKACEQSVMDAERLFMNKLESAKKFKRTRLHLSLFDKNGEHLLRMIWRDFD